MRLFPTIREIRSSVATPEKWLTEWFNGGYETNAGTAVDEASAMYYSAFFCGVNILAGTLMQTPLFLYERKSDGSKSRATKRRLYKVLHDRANPSMSAARWRQTMMGHIVTWGNCYSQIVWGSDGEVKELRALRPDRVKIESVDGKVVKKYLRNNAEPYVFKPGELLHIPGFGYDGVQGYSLVTLARESIGMGMAVDEFGARFFGHGANVGGLISLKARLSGERRKEVKNDLIKKHSGLEKSHGLLVLEEDASYTRIGIPPEDSQFLETRKFQVVEIARWLNIPVQMLKDTEKMTYSNYEYSAIDFNTYTMGPWQTLFETEIEMQLLREDELDSYFVEFNADALLRGDTLTRYRAHSIGRQWGWLSANDIRRTENMDPIPEGGDNYMVPLNMVPSDQQMQDGQNATDDYKDEKSVDRQKRLETIKRAYGRLFEDQFGVIKRRIEKDVKTVIGKADYLNGATYIRRQLEPLFQSMAEEMTELSGRQSQNERVTEFIDGIVNRMKERWVDEAINPMSEADSAVTICAGHFLYLEEQ